MEVEREDNSFFIDCPICGFNIETKTYQELIDDIDDFYLCSECGHIFTIKADYDSKGFIYG